MLLDSFEVENFRSLKHLKLEKLARVNLLMGKNDVGKTSVLESVWALRNVRNTDWLFQIESERNVDGDRADFRQLFFKFDGAMIIKLRAVYKQDFQTNYPAYSLNISAGLIRSQPSDWSVRRGLEVSSRRSTNNALSFEIDFFNEKGKQAVELVLHRSEDDKLFFQVNSDKAREFITNPLPLPRNYGTEFITTTISRVVLSEKVEALKVAKQDEAIIRILQQVNPLINRLELGNGRQIYLDLGEDFPTLMPLNLMGDGVQRLLDITTAIAQMPNGSVLIDEIDNGLHYSALRVLWKGILQAAREYDVQVFATTHSAEALRHLTWVLDEEDGKQYRGDVAAYTLVRADDYTVRSYRHDYEQLDYALDHGIEIRN